MALTPQPLLPRTPAETQDELAYGRHLRARALAQIEGEEQAAAAFAAESWTPEATVTRRWSIQRFALLLAAATPVGSALLRGQEALAANAPAYPGSMRCAAPQYGASPYPAQPTPSSGVPVPNPVPPATPPHVDLRPQQAPAYGGPPRQVHPPVATPEPDPTPAPAKPKHKKKHKRPAITKPATPPPGTY